MSYFFIIPTTSLLPAQTLTSLSSQDSEVPRQLDPTSSSSTSEDNSSGQPTASTLFSMELGNALPTAQIFAGLNGQRAVRKDRQQTPTLESGI
ncbi:hypothetical protein WR25_23149 [Diploscapter pachys]|uniref:Uncharacterized protein n=1 Tax=Diploscapter pachys TaxID=2018661 RepID=A0A2A2M0B1_9BILA|nr:hypothetical protein WR25_23149 [Diploscapter pachys]